MFLFNPLDILNGIIKDVSKSINKYCVNPGKDFTRNRKLPVDKLLKFILESEGNSINAEIFKSFPKTEERMSASAFVQQRSKLKADVFLEILRMLNQTMDNSKRFKVCNVFAIDGTDLYFPPNPKSECYVKTSQKCKDGTDAKGYCLLHANILYDVKAGFNLTHLAG